MQEQDGVGEADSGRLNDEEKAMTRLDWALVCLTPMGWVALSTLWVSLSDTDPSSGLLAGAILTLACWGVYLGWGRP